MASRIRTVTIDCADPYELASWWSDVVGAPLHADDEPGDPEAAVVLPDGTGWVTLLDPAGNELCVLCSAAERAATSGSTTSPP